MPDHSLTLLWSLSVSIKDFGALLGTLGVKYLADSYGRLGNKMYFCSISISASVFIFLSRPGVTPSWLLTSCQWSEHVWCLLPNLASHLRCSSLDGWCLGFSVVWWWLWTHFTSRKCRRPIWEGHLLRLTRCLLPRAYWWEWYVSAKYSLLKAHNSLLDD